MAMHHFLTSNDSLKTRKWKNSVTPVTWNGPETVSTREAKYASSAGTKPPTGSAR